MYADSHIKPDDCTATTFDLWLDGVCYAQGLSFDYYHSLMLPDFHYAEVKGFQNYTYRNIWANASLGNDEDDLYFQCPYIEMAKGQTVDLASLGLEPCVRYRDIVVPVCLLPNKMDGQLLFKCYAYNGPDGSYYNDIMVYDVVAVDDTAISVYGANITVNTDIQPGQDTTVRIKYHIGQISPTSFGWASLFVRVTDLV